MLEQIENFRTSLRQATLQHTLESCPLTIHGISIINWYHGPDLPGVNINDTPEVGKRIRDAGYKYISPDSIRTEDFCWMHVGNSGPEVAINIGAGFNISPEDISNWPQDALINQFNDSTRLIFADVRPENDIPGSGAYSDAFLNGLAAVGIVSVALGIFGGGKYDRRTFLKIAPVVTGAGLLTAAAVLKINTSNQIKEARQIEADTTNCIYPAKPEDPKPALMGLRNGIVTYKLRMYLAKRNIPAKEVAEIWGYSHLRVAQDTFNQSLSELQDAVLTEFNNDMSAAAQYIKENADDPGKSDEALCILTNKYWDMCSLTVADMAHQDGGINIQATEHNYFLELMGKTGYHYDTGMEEGKDLSNRMQIRLADLCFYVKDQIQKAGDALKQPQQ